MIIVVVEVVLVWRLRLFKRVGLISMVANGYGGGGGREGIAGECY